MDRYFAVVARGVEPLAVKELEALGATEIQPVPGGVRFSGPREVLYRALLTLRTATRVLKPLREFAATTPDMVYSQVRRIVWEAYLNPTRTLSVSATAEKPPIPGGRPNKSGPPSRGFSRGGPRDGARPPRDPSEPPPPPLGGTKWLYNTMFAALKIKDAICDRLKNEQGARPDVDKENPDVVIQAHFAAGRCTLSLDATGPSLHERGYRAERGSGGAAPLKETLAAAILQVTEWNGLVPLYDPMCGSGTLVIEAARMALHMPTGGARPFFACEKWPDFDGTIWAQITTDLRSKQLRKLPAPIFGSDGSESQLTAAGDNAFRARVDQSGLSFILRDIEEAIPPTDEPGILVTNPPYGVRLGDEEHLCRFYSRMGELFRDRFKGWIVYVMSGNPTLSRALEMTPDAEHKLWNGPIPCRLLRFNLTKEVIVVPVYRKPVWEPTPEPEPVSTPPDDVLSDETDETTEIETTSAVPEPVVVPEEQQVTETVPAIPTPDSGVQEVPVGDDSAIEAEPIVEPLVSEPTVAETPVAEPPLAVPSAAEAVATPPSPAVADENSEAAAILEYYERLLGNS